jgi:phage-related holin
MVYIVPALIFFIFYCKKTWVWAKEHMEETDGASTFIAIIPTVAAFIAIIVAFPLDEIKTMVKIKAAPKVYLIEEAANIIQTIRKESK